MAFTESTSVATRDAFIQAVVSFAVTNAGFTDEGTSIDGADTIYHISKGGFFWNFLEEGPFAHSGGGLTQYAVMCRISFAKITTRASFIDDVTTTIGMEQPARMAVYTSTGPYVKYYLYTEGTAVHCALEVYADVFTHMSFGNITKFGTWTGGEYVTTMSGTLRSFSSPFPYTTFKSSQNMFIFDGGFNTFLTTGQYDRSAYVRYVIGAAANDKTDFARIGAFKRDSKQCKMASVGAAWPTATTPIVNAGIYNTLIETCGSSGVNLRAPLLSIPVHFIEDATDRWAIRGYVPYAKIVAVPNLAPGTIVENDWIVFPLTQRAGGDNVLAPISDNWGVAYRRVA